MPRSGLHPDAATSQVAETPGRFTEARVEAWVKAARRFVTRLRAEVGTRVSRVLLFGSVARGKPGPGSDVDLLVVIDKSDLVLERRICDLASAVSLERDVTLSPVIYSRERFERPLFRATKFFTNLLREGIEL